MTKWNDKKQKDGRGLGLRRLLIDDFPNNNQPKIGVQDGGKYEGAGEAKFHCCGGVEVRKEIKH